MQIILVRHEMAMDPIAFALQGKPDSERPITETGRQRLRQTSKAVQTLVGRISTIYTSPYLRCVQTAELLQEVFVGCSLKPCSLLKPNMAPAGVLDFLNSESDFSSHAETVILVSHEPLIGMMVSYFSSGQMNSYIEFKRGAFCSLKMTRARSGEALLSWYLPPIVMTSLASLTGSIENSGERGTS